MCSQNLNHKIQVCAQDPYDLYKNFLDFTFDQFYAFLHCTSTFEFSSSAMEKKLNFKRFAIEGYRTLRMVEFGGNM